MRVRQSDSNVVDFLGSVMPWWAWVIAGVVLMGLELAAIDAAFYLVFLGAAAVIVGIAVLGDPSLPVWVQWVLYGVLAVASMVFFRRKLYDRMRGGAQGFDNSTVGEVVELTEDVPPGGSTRIDMRGSRWTATNVGTAPMGAGARARVVAVSGAGVDILPMSAQGTSAETPDD